MFCNKQTKLNMFILLTVVALAVLSLPLAATAQELSDFDFMDDPNLEAEHRMSGTVEGTGTCFEVNDSNYLNIKFESSESVNLKLESVPQMVVMDIEAAEGASSTQITLTGFDASTTYYKYEDNYHNLVTLTTNDNGSCSYKQDITEHHQVFIQPQPSTKFIPSDTSIGTWNEVRRIYTLTTDVSETIQIDEDNLTLDGAGHTVSGSGTSGVFLHGRTEVTVTNLNVVGFTVGFRLGLCSGCILTGNTAFDNNYGITLHTAEKNTIENNTVSQSITSGSNTPTGIYLLGNASDNTLKDNTVKNCNKGIHLDAPDYGGPKFNTLTGNTVSDNKLGIFVE